MLLLLMDSQGPGHSLATPSRDYIRWLESILSLVLLHCAYSGHCQPRNKGRRKRKATLMIRVHDAARSTSGNAGVVSRGACTPCARSSTFLISPEIRPVCFRRRCPAQPHAPDQTRCCCPPAPPRRRALPSEVLRVKEPAACFTVGAHRSSADHSCSVGVGHAAGTPPSAGMALPPPCPRQPGQASNESGPRPPTVPDRARQHWTPSQPPSFRCLGAGVCTGQPPPPLR